MMLTNHKLVILCLLIPAVLTSVCEDFVSRQEQRKTSNDYSSLTSEEIAFKDFSGGPAGRFDFGNQDLCLQNPKMYYFVAVKRWQTEEGLLRSALDERALCLPRDCSMLLHTTNDPLLIRIYEVRNLDAYVGPPLVDVCIELYDPAQNMNSKPVMFYITSIFILLCVLLSAASTIVLYYRSKKIVLLDKESPKKKEQNRLDCVWKSFDLKRNWINLYQTAAEQKQNQNIAIFQILRILTSYWVIYLHVSPITSQRYQQSPKSPSIEWTGTLSVDYFFMMTGFLGAYTLVPKLSKEGGKIMTYYNIIKHRLLRVRPLYMVALLVAWQVTPYLTTGIRWHVAELDAMRCDQTWWRNFLMVDNLVNLQDMSKYGGYCFSYGWYLSIEFQMYLVALLAIAVYAKYRRIGYILVIGLILQGFAVALAVHFDFKLDHFFFTAASGMYYNTKHKYMPYARWNTMFIGVLWGLLYFEYTKLKKKNIFWIYETKPIISYLTMICGAVLNAFVITEQFNRSPLAMSAGERYAWDPIQMMLITVSITMIFMPLMSNRSFYLKSFFNLRIFQILGKTSYAVYLFQPNFIYLIEWSTINTFESSYGPVFSESIKVIAATQAFGFFAHIFLEKPMLNLETELSSPRKQKSTPKDSKAKIEMQPTSDKIHDKDKEESEHVLPINLETASPVEIDQKERAVSPASTFLPPSNDN